MHFSTTNKKKRNKNDKNKMWNSETNTDNHYARNGHYVQKVKWPLFIAHNMKEYTSAVQGCT